MRRARRLARFVAKDDLAVNDLIAFHGENFGAAVQDRLLRISDEQSDDGAGFAGAVRRDVEPEVATVVGAGEDNGAAFVVDRANDEARLAEMIPIHDASVEDECRRIADRRRDFAALDFRGCLGREALLQLDSSRSGGELRGSRRE